MSGFSHSSALRRVLAAVAAGTVLATGSVATASADPGERGRDGDRVLKASLNGKKERPERGDRNGRGKARIELRRDHVCFSLSWRRIAAPTAAHIHRGTRKEAGPVVVPLFSVPGGLGAPVRAVAGCAEVDRALIRALRNDPRDYYVNIHNAAFPNGAIRGQLHQ